jgi:hypothetical protein
MSTPKATVVQQATLLTFAFAHGAILEAEISSLPEEIKEKLLVYGARQKLQDSYSGKKDSREAEASLKNVWERLLTGDWTAARASTGEGSTTTKLAQALIRLTGKEEKVIVDLLGTMDENQIKAVRARADVKATLAAMRAEELAKKVTAEAGAEEEADILSLF